MGWEGGEKVRKREKKSGLVLAQEAWREQSTTEELFYAVFRRSQRVLFPSEPLPHSLTLSFFSNPLSSPLPSRLLLALRLSMHVGVCDVLLSSAPLPAQQSRWICGMANTMVTLRSPELGPLGWDAVTKRQLFLQTVSSKLRPKTAGLPTSLASVAASGSGSTPATSSLDGATTSPGTLASPRAKAAVGSASVSSRDRTTAGNQLPQKGRQIQAMGE